MVLPANEGSSLAITPCIPPSALRFKVRVPFNVAQATGRCGHPIGEEHILLIETEQGAILVRDRAAMKERARDSLGRRPLGFLGRHFGWSIHACDGCRRAWSLNRTILCPCCGMSIPEWHEVELVPCGAVRPDPTFADFATLSMDCTKMVICARCAHEKRGPHALDDEDDTSSPSVSIWMDRGVITFPNDATPS